MSRFRCMRPLAALVLASAFGLLGAASAAEAAAICNFNAGAVTVTGDGTNGVGLSTTARGVVPVGRLPIMTTASS